MNDRGLPTPLYLRTLTVFIIIEYITSQVSAKMVLVSKENKRKIYEYLLNEGVIVVKKDSYLPKHQQLDVPNLHVQMIVKSLKSKGFLQEVFSWQWAYYTITNKGVAYLVKELALPADIVPATFKKKRTAATADGARTKGYEGEDEKPVAEESARPTGLGRGSR
jgi:small subunit ribosomal protein S10e